MSTQSFPVLGGHDAPCDTAVASCRGSDENWIDLEYLYEDQTGVAGAAYVVQEPNGGRHGGNILAEGFLDAKGQAHVPLPVGIRQVEIYFHDDPDGEPYVDPQTPSTEEPEPGFLQRLWDGACEAASFVGGVLAGDFNENPSVAQIIVNTILTMIPVIDQLADARDVIANLKKLLWERRWDEWAVWLGIFLCMIGLIPTLGSLAKGIIRVALKRASKLADLLGVFNFFKKGNGIRWLRDFARDLPTRHARAAAAKLGELLDRALEYLRKARDGWFVRGYVKETIDYVTDSIEQARGLVQGKFEEVASVVSRRIIQALDDALSPIIPSSVKRRVRWRQWAQRPPHSNPSLRPTAFDNYDWESFRTGRHGQIDLENLSLQDQEMYDALARQGRNEAQIKELLESSTGASGRTAMEPGDKLYGFVSEEAAGFKNAENPYWVTEADYQQLKADHYHDGVWDRYGVKQTLALPCHNRADALVEAEVTQPHQALRSEIGQADERLQYFNQDGSAATEEFINRMPGGGWQTTPDPNSIQIIGSGGN